MSVKNKTEDWRCYFIKTKEKAVRKVNDVTGYSINFEQTLHPHLQLFPTAHWIMF